MVAKPTKSRSESGKPAMRYMLDTNICIHLIQHRPPEVLARFRELGHGEVVMSAITHVELRHGVERCDSR